MFVLHFLAQARHMYDPPAEAPFGTLHSTAANILALKQLVRMVSLSVQLGCRGVIQESRIRI